MRRTRFELVPPFGEQRLNIKYLNLLVVRRRISRTVNEPRTCRLKPLGHLPILLQTTAVEHNIRLSLCVAVHSDFRILECFKQLLQFCCRASYR
jgi:hypothetical protein